jgi:alpha-beta hydrolase superfamily lysophospholipase
MVLIGAEDIIVSQKAAKEQLIEDPKSVFKIYEDARHELLIEKEAITKLVWKNIETFLVTLQRNQT